MWRFQGACDASAIMHEQERQIREKDREIGRVYGELQRRKEGGGIKEYEVKWDDFAKPDSGSTHSHFRHFDSNASEGKVRYIQKFCLKEIKRVMEEEDIGAKQAVMDLAGRWEREGRKPVRDGIFGSSDQERKVGNIEA